MPTYDTLNTQLAPGKSVFDSQQIHRPTAYRHCGRASLCIGIVCILAEVGVFVLKRGLTTLGIGIWTGASFIIFGAASMAVPKTRSVCSVNTCFVMALGSMLICVLGTLTCVLHAFMINSILDASYTPRPNFELSCEYCGYAIIIKEAAQVTLLLAQFLVSLALLYFAYTDCLCCRSTETEILLGPVRPSTSTETPPVTSGLPAGSASVTVNHQQQASAGGSSSATAAAGLVSVSSFQQPAPRGTSGPMLYEL